MKVNVKQVARKIDVDNGIPLHYYYRIADNLLHQASVYREENDLVNLYIILLRFSSLVYETIPFHKDYQTSLPKHREKYRKRLLSVLDELEFLKPKYQHKLDELTHKHKIVGADELDGSQKSSRGTQFPNATPYTAWKHDEISSEVSSSNVSETSKQSSILSFNLPPPKQETLSRHSFLGPGGLHGQWIGPPVDVKVQYPSSTKFLPAEESSYSSNQSEKIRNKLPKSGDPAELGSFMESVLSLDDGSWRRNDLLSTEASQNAFQFVGIQQPSPPPVLARVQHEIPPSKVADPRPGSAVGTDGKIQNLNSYQHVHVPVNLMDEFLRLARSNTQKNLETCAVLAGILRNRVFNISTLIIPKQESTSDSCSTLNEEEIFEVQDKLSLFPLGWIHTHPTQTCFMSSVDLHTHYSYQIMLPESIAIVMAPTDESSPHGIFHLSDPSGVSAIRNCERRGFHPHEEPPDGSPIYEHCSHVFFNSKLKYDVIDLR